MDISFFRRGIKLPSRPASDSINEISPPRRVSILLKQESGPPCNPVVGVGEAVKVGQLVADGTQAGIANLHASVSGEVKAIETVLLSDGTEARAIVIEADGSDTKCAPEPTGDPLTADPADLLERIRRAGVIRSGRESKSVYAAIKEAMSPRGRLSATGTAISKQIRHLAVRFCDTDPHLRSLRAITETIGNDTANLKLGLDALTRITGAEQVHLVFDKRQAAQRIKKLADENDLPVVSLDGDNYPAFSAPMVAVAVSGREPNIDFKRVHESGVLVLDVDTVLECADAVREQLPVYEKTITVVTGQGPRVFKARLGTSIAHIASGAAGKAAYKVVLGGPMQGLAHHTLEFPLGKDTSAVTLLSRNETAPAVNDPCIGCGLCAQVCPMRLTPGMLSRFCEFGQFEAAEDAHLFTCIECGCCAYVCPAGRSMVHFMVQGKSQRLAARRVTQ